MDQRKAPRYKRRIQLRFWSADDRKPRKGFTQNISVMGMFVSTNAPFKPRKGIIWRFPPAEGSLTGELVSGMGVAFSDPADVITQFSRVLSALEQT